ncbi:MAG: DUF6088 family protein [Candidatus Planktophila sp.]|nr:DUF6088 family protein [Candidatus Planktophila sp.]
MKSSTQSRIARSVSRSKRDVFLRTDFSKFGTPSRVTRGISELVNKGKLIKLGYGVYAKAVPSAITGNPVPRKVLETLAVETFSLLGVPITMGSARTNYSTGTSTQIPMSISVSTGSTRINRKLKLGNREIAYEKPFPRTS